MSTPTDTPIPESSAERSRWACTPCRQRKVKCDSTLPACSTCVAKELDCVYSHKRLRAPTSRKSGSSSRAGMIRRLQQVEQMVQSLTPGNTVENVAHLPSSRQLHVSPLAHLGFDTLCEESYVTSPDVLYRLIRRDALPMARIGPPDQPVAKFQYQSSCCIFDVLHIKCVDYMIGNQTFSKLCSRSLHPNFPSLNLSGGPMHPLPMLDTALQCLRIFLESVNSDFQFFRNEEIEGVFQNYVQGQSCPSQGVYAAISMVCACASWTLHGAQNAMTERLVENAMRVLPGIMMEAPDTLAVGTLLLMTAYLESTSRSSPAATVLGSVTQMMLLAGYHVATSSSGALSTDQLHKNRLFYRAYVMDQRLSLRLFKPPLLTERLVIGLPDEHPVDSHGVIKLSEGRSLNYLRQQVLLAKIQDRVYDNLRSPLPSAKGSQNHLKATSKLLSELQQWANDLPASARPPNVAEDLSIPHAMQITSLHRTYFQTIIAIHSSIFCHIPYFSDPAIREITIKVVNECASAARNILCLSVYTEKNNPFMLDMCHDLGWSIDGLLLSIVLYRQTPGAQQDMELLKGFLHSFETNKPQHDGRVIYEALTIIYKSALEALSLTDRDRDQPEHAWLRLPAPATDIQLNPQTFDDSSEILS
ncbi:putative transcriptional regulatory protein [Colletotrichum fructicola]|nr:putative transcriptional regulatory protein [Colletotrichum fructicola]